MWSSSWPLKKLKDLIKYPELKTDEHLSCFPSILLDDNSIMNFILKVIFYKNDHRKMWNYVIVSGLYLRFKINMKVLRALLKVHCKHALHDSLAVGLSIAHFHRSKRPGHIKMCGRTYIVQHFQPMYLFKCDWSVSFYYIVAIFEIF